MQKRVNKLDFVEKWDEFSFKGAKKCAYAEKCKGFVKAKALFCGLWRAFGGGWGKESCENALLSLCHKGAKFSQIPCYFRTWKQYE